MTDPLHLLPFLLLIGCLGGFLSGLLGVGGGTIFVPALFFAMTAMDMGGDHVMHLAVGSSLAVVVTTVVTSSRAHHRKGAVDLKLLKSWGPFLTLGVVAGALFAGSVDGKILKEAFAVLTLAVAFYMAFGREEAVRSARKLPESAQKFLCLLIGVIAAMTGMGGAVMTIPLMSHRGLPMHTAIGTGAALGVLISVAGMASYAYTGWPHMDELPPLSLGYVNLAAIACIAPAAILVAPYGVRVAHKLNRITLRRIFAAVMVAVSLKMFMTI